jgi:Fe-S-cluster containining protein
VPPASLTLDAAASPDAHAHLTGMLRELQIALRSAMLPSPTDDATEVEDAAIDRAFAAYDAYIAHVRAAHPMSCRIGCAACCHDNPRGVTGIELERLVIAIAELPDADAILTRFAELASRRTDEADWRRRREPCPLLDGEGRCRTYAARPIACRSFHAITPAKQCDPADPGYDDRVNPHLDPPAQLVQILRALSALRRIPDAPDLHTGMARFAPR